MEITINTRYYDAGANPPKILWEIIVEGQQEVCSLMWDERHPSHLDAMQAAVKHLDQIVSMTGGYENSNYPKKVFSGKDCPLWFHKYKNMNKQD
jgi:hypothetical protein